MDNINVNNNNNNMAKVKNNAAEIIITVIATALLLTSCAGNHYTCPSYAGVTEAEVGDMYANQTWGEDEQSRPNYVFINY
jgi:PBP1b-binding outer membrane lipoprotein LpoB